MLDTLLVTLYQMLFLFFFILAGCFLSAKKIIDKQIAPSLSKLLAWLFLPALMIRTFANNFQPANIKEYLPFLIASAVVLVIAVPLALLLAKVVTKDGYERKIFTYSFIIPNLGYLGYPLIEAVFGSEMLLKYTVFCIPMNVFIYSVGINMFKGEEDSGKKASFKGLITPPLIAMPIGILLGLLQVKLPTVMGSIIDTAAGCMAPVAMLLTGIVLSKHKIGAAFVNGKNYIAAGVRLVLIPALFLGLFMLLRLIVPLNGEIIVVAVAALCLPLGLNAVVFPEYHNRDGTLGAQSNLICNLLGFITVPVAYSLLSLLL